MTDPLPTPAAKTSRGVKIALALSLALNLAVGGLVAGAALRTRGDDGGARQSVRDINLGPFTQALTREQRRDVLGRLGDGGLGLRDMRDQMRGDMAAVLAALQADPFDPLAVEAAFAQQSARLNARADAGRAALVGVILSLSPEDRATFTQRLEQSIRRGPGDGRRG